MVPHANWHHPASEHTKYSTYQQHCTGSKFSLWWMKMTTTAKLAELSFLSLVCVLVPLNAELLVVVVVGCVQGSWSQVSTFSCYSHCLPLTQNASKGVSEQFPRTFAIIQIKYVLLKLYHLPQYSYGSRLRLVPGFRDPGSVLILGQVTQYDNPYLICITGDHNLILCGMMHTEMAPKCPFLQCYGELELSCIVIDRYHVTHLSLNIFAHHVYIERILKK